MNTFTPAQFIEAFDAVVASKGIDYVYPETEKWEGSCRYAVPIEDEYGRPIMGDTPSCVVGHAVFQIAGVAGLHALYEGAGAVVVLNDLVALDSDNLAVRLAAGAAQTLQDGGWPWGVAQKAFHYVYENSLSNERFAPDVWYVSNDSILMPHAWAVELKLEHLIPAGAVAEKLAVEGHQHTV